MKFLPRLYYICDFPPDNKGGGDTLLFRLLKGYPVGRLFLTFSKRRDGLLAGSEFERCQRACIPELTGARRHGRAQVTLLIDRSLLPFHAMFMVRNIVRWKVDVVLSVAHGYLFLAAGLAAMLTKRPLILIVHDDWVEMEKHVRLFRHLLRPLFGWALRRASRVLAVSQTMADHLKSNYGINSEIQWPATYKTIASEAGEVKSGSQACRIAFAGMIYGTVHQSLNYLVHFIHANPNLDVELHIYSNYGAVECTAYGWASKRVHVNKWVDQKELQATLRRSDILFLPVSFERGSSYYAKTSFPSKLADYLAVGRPILVLAPRDAAITAYVEQHQCAEVVSELSQEAIFTAVSRLVTDAERRQALIVQSRAVYSANHNMVHQKRRFHEILLAENAEIVTTTAAQFRTN